MTMIKKEKFKEYKTPGLNDVRKANDGTERVTIFYGLTSGLIYGICPIDQFPKKMSKLNDFYDSLKLLTVYNADVNSQLNELLDGENSTEYDETIKEGTLKITIPNERALKNPIVSENKITTAGRTSSKDLLRSLYLFTEELKHSDDFIESDIVSDLKESLSKMIKSVPKVSLGNMDLLLETIGVFTLRIDNDKERSYQEKIDFNYQCFCNQNEILKDLGIWMPREFCGFIDYEVIKTRKDSLIDYE